MGNILVIGSLNMDVTIFSDRAPAPGETIKGNGFLLSPGGKGANQAIAASRLGANVTMFGRVGDDSFGKALIGYQRENGVDTRHIRRLEGVSTGIASIFVCGGANYIILAPGANDHITPLDIDEAAPLIAKSDALLLQMEIPKDAVAHAIGIAKAKGTRIFFDPAPALPLEKALLSGIDYLMPNETEAASLLGWPNFSPESAGLAVEAFCALGVKHPVITLGDAGVAYWDGSRCVFAPSFPARAVDTTAAGDTFTGALACAVVKGEPLDRAVAFAQRAASICVTRKGASEAIPTLEEVLAQ